jgi:hypothetical protein
MFVWLNSNIDHPETVGQLMAVKKNVICTVDYLEVRKNIYLQIILKQQHNGN